MPVHPINMTVKLKSDDTEPVSPSYCFKRLLIVYGLTPIAEIPQGMKHNRQIYAPACPKVSMRMPLKKPSAMNIGPVLLPPMR